MMRMRVAVAVLLLAAVFPGCSERANTAKSGDVSSASSGIAPEAELPLPSVPDTLTTPESRAEYVACHFWDGLDFSNTALSLDSAFMEQNFANFISLFPIIGPDVITSASEHLFGKAAPNAQAQSLLVYIAEKYLYDPNSPMRDERAFVWLAEGAMKAPALAAADRERMELLCEAARKNAVGAVAADFAFTAEDGSGTLHRFCNGGKRTVLIFYDPGCETCIQAKKQLESDPVMTQLLGSGRLRVLAVYPDGDGELWRGSLSSFPAGWTPALERGVIDSEDLYELPAMPTIYLLDSEARVILKDPSPDALLRYLAANPI